MVFIFVVDKFATFEELAYIYFLRGDVYYTLGKHEDARHDFDIVLQRDPDFLSNYDQRAAECRFFLQYLNL